ncbi:asparagine synthase (glutamine-hydrolyzing) [bacterium]|nr:asparagine synthase (glutamine-hydrolyzing) [bacterium]
MCGIVALYDDQQPPARQAVERALGAMSSRGPDGQGIWAPLDGPCALGHRRLAVIDLEGGRQPLHSGRLWLVANGEFYDYERTLDWLRGRGHRPATGSDSEVVLLLYQEMGLECLSWLRGEFAFALWDGAAERLLLVRDRFGIKPLFYARQNRRLWAASEIKGLFAAGWDCAWDEEGVNQSLHQCLHQDRTMFRGVRQLPAGHYLLADRRGVQIVRYWDQRYPRPRTISQPQALEEISRPWHEAVRLRTRADVPLACYLSGGVDSSAVLSLAQQYATQPLHAFTLAFDQEGFDESSLARGLCDRVGAVFHQVSASREDLSQAFEATVIAAEAPIYNGHAPARWLLSQAVHRAGFKVVLGGEGADELFAGYRFAARTGSSGGWWALLRRLLSPGSAELREISPTLAVLLKALPLPAPMFEYLFEQIRCLRSLAKVSGRDPYRDFLVQVLSPGLFGREPVKVLLYVWMKSLFVNYILAAERLDMAHGVELRLPFLDHVLFEAVKGLSSQVLGPDKQLLRQLAAARLTSEVLATPKRPFISPPLGDRLRPWLQAPEVAEIPFLHTKRVRHLGAVSDGLLFYLASLVVLQRHYRPS